ncbi:MAG: tetratricopeptide repeat protein [Candidatus Caenarcaniphilales bacterium]|nr:tetratricopeptide repeat protein [Candidatus Caenarcaniphilales bacterium]
MIDTNKLKSNLFLLVGIIVGSLIIAGILYYVATYEERSLHKAKGLLQEYKTAKALEIIERIKLQQKKKNPEIDFLLFYTYLKSNEFAKAESLLEHLEPFQESQREEFLEMIAKLNFHEENKLMIKMLDQAHQLHLSSDYFINVSKKKESIVAESLVLEEGIQYHEEDTEELTKLNNYLIKRYIEVAQIEHGNKDYHRAVKYLEKARERSIKQKGSPYESDIYLNLGLVHRAQKKYEQAWQYIQLSSKLGNEKAKDLIKHMQNNY